MSRMAEIARALRGEKPDSESMKRAQALVRRRTQEAERVVREGADRASADIASRMRPLSMEAAITAKELVSKGVPPGQAIRAVARVAEWKFLWGQLGPFAADAAALSTAPIQLWGRRIRKEF